MEKVNVTAAELRTLAGRVSGMTIGEAEAACALATAALGYGVNVRGVSLIACVIRHLLDAADSIELREMARRHDETKAVAA